MGGVSSNDIKSSSSGLTVSCDVVGAIAGGTEGVRSTGASSTDETGRAGRGPSREYSLPRQPRSDAILAHSQHVRSAIHEQPSTVFGHCLKVHLVVSPNHGLSSAPTTHLSSLVFLHLPPRPVFMPDIRVQVLTGDGDTVMEQYRPEEILDVSATASTEYTVRRTTC